MDPSAVAALIAAIFGAGGLTGGVVALLKYRGESTAVLVSASGEVVIMQKSMISELRAELDQARREHAAEVARCQDTAAGLRRELEILRRDVGRSHSRHDTQDAVIKQLQDALPGRFDSPDPTPGQEPETPPAP